MVAIAPTDTEIIVIGSGIGGLTCAAMLARYGFDVIVCESHSIAGGAAHGFERGGFSFDSGPSLYSGLSYSPSANPCGKCWMPSAKNSPASPTIPGVAVCQKAISTHPSVRVNLPKCSHNCAAPQQSPNGGNSSASWNPTPKLPQPCPPWLCASIWAVFLPSVNLRPLSCKLLARRSHLQALSAK